MRQNTGNCQTATKKNQKKTKTKKKNYFIKINIQRYLNVWMLADQNQLYVCAKSELFTKLYLPWGSKWSACMLIY